MSFTTYPILSAGSNVDLIRQAHNLITEAVGDIAGLNTLNNVSVVDAINALQVAFEGLTGGGLGIIDNQVWLQGYNTSASPLNMIRINASNEMEIGTVITPLLSTLDIGKTGDGFRNYYALGTVYTNNFAPYSGSTQTFTFTSTAVAFAEESATDIKLEAVADNLNLKSLRTRVYSGSNYWENSTSGHLIPDGNNTKDIGLTGTRVRKVYATDADLSGTLTSANVTVSTNITNNGTQSNPNEGLQVPIGAGLLWFTDTPPTNFGIANGQQVSRATYPALTTLWDLGGGNYKYGNGNGTTTINLPDMRKMIPFGADSTQTSSPDASTPGKTFGALNHTHVTVMPKHNHSFGTLVLSSADLTHKHNIASDLVTGNESATHTHGLSINFSGSGTTGASGTSVGVQRVTQSSLTTGNYVARATGTLTSDAPVTDPTHTHTVSVSGTVSGDTYGISNYHTHSITTTEFNSKIGNPTVAMNAHTHTLSGLIGQTTGSPSNGDIDNSLTSSTNNPPCFAVHYIIRLK